MNPEPITIAKPVEVVVRPYANMDDLDPGCGQCEGLDYEAGTMLLFVPNEEPPYILLQESGITVTREALRYVQELVALAAHPGVQKALMSYEMQHNPLHAAGHTHLAEQGRQAEA